QKQKKLIMLPSETMIWQPEFTDKTLSRKTGAVHSLRQTLPVFEDVYRKTGVQQAILRTCSRKKVIFLSHSLVIDNKRGARNEQNANRRSCGRDSFTRFKRSGTNRTGRLSATASAHDEPP
ncbi:hypothetical protein ACP813_07050, partial [Escherichia coli]